MQDSARTQAIDLETAAGQDKLNLRLWLRLLTCANIIETEVRSRMRVQFSLTLPQFDLMAQLERAPETGLTMGELGSRMMVSAGNITGITDRLERDGHVMRVRSSADRRSQNVRLTDSGRSYFAVVARAHENWIADMFDDMPVKSRTELFDRLGTLKQTVLAHTTGGNGGDD